jgi:hypothetical protein
MLADEHPYHEQIHFRFKKRAYLLTLSSFNCGFPVKRLLVLFAFGLALQCVAGTRSAMADIDCSKIWYADMSQNDCEVLVKLFNSTGGLGWYRNDGWNVTLHPCSWYGVTCRVWHVVKLRLAFNHLSQFALFAWQRQSTSDTASSIFFPTILNTMAGSNPEDAIMTGVALANLGTANVSFNLMAFDPTGALITGTGIRNPVSMELNPGTQIPTVDFQIFGDGFLAAQRAGWMKVETTSGKVTAFFEVFNQIVSMLDGADVSGAAATYSVLPEIENEGFTRIQIP